MRKKIISVLFKWLIGILFIVLLLPQINAAKLSMIVRQMDWIYILMFMSLYPVSVAFSTYKWQLILANLGTHVQFVQLFQTYWLGSFLNNFLPTDFGGDVYKFARIRKYTHNKKRLIASLFLERLLGLIGIVIVVCAIGAPFILNYRQRVLTGIYLLAWIIIAGLISLKYTQGLLKKIAPRLLKKLTLLFSISPKTLHTSLLLSVLFVGQSSLAYWIVFMAVGVKLDLLLLMFLVPMTILTGLIPLSPGALGLREGVAVYLFGIAGVAPEKTLVVYLTARILVLITNSLGSVYFYFFRNTYS